jgi:hypothetical protein
MANKKTLAWVACAALLLPLLAVPAAAWSISASYWSGYGQPSYAYPAYGYYAPTYYAPSSGVYYAPSYSSQSSSSQYYYSSSTSSSTTSVTYNAPASASSSSQDSTQSYCGDGWCSQGETAQNCPQDCSPGAYCGDGVCNNGETAESCPYDCEITVSITSATYCGDSVCNGAETPYSCAGDCGHPPYCGDSVCNGTETKYNCPQDCGLAPYCGDSVCNGAETKYNCPTDCGLPPYCGDGICNGDETPYSCSLDCGNPSCTNPTGVLGATTCSGKQMLVCMNGFWEFSRSVQCCNTGDCPLGYKCVQNSCQLNLYCGDGVCSSGENQQNCPQDCGYPPYCGDGVCGSGETKYNCPQDCGYPPSCGDGVCNGDETCATCPVDCGICYYCGDGVCNSQTENQLNCPQDCGSPVNREILLAAPDDCQEIIRGESGSYSLILYNYGDFDETVSVLIYGPTAAWFSMSAPVNVPAGGSELVTLNLSVPVAADPGLYNISVTASNTRVSASAELKLDVRLEPLEGAIPVGGNASESQETGSGIDETSTLVSGAFIAGDLVIPVWLLLVGALLVLAVLFIFLSGRVTRHRTYVLATDGGSR